MPAVFDHDPFADVLEAFNRLYQGRTVRVQWLPELEHYGLLEEDQYPLGVTWFDKQGAVAPVVKLSMEQPVGVAVETLAHELAHVVAGPEVGHGEEWQKAFDAIWEMFCVVVQERAEREGGCMVMVGGDEDAS